jgi:ATP phosphoribosyltransferase
MAARLPGYRVVSVSGAAEAYPPEDADLALVAAPDRRVLRRHGLTPLHHLLDSSAWLIANRDSLEGKDLSPVLQPLLAGAPPATDEARLRLPAPPTAAEPAQPLEGDFSDKVRIAIPDGHQQGPAAEALTAAGLEFQDYDSSGAARRPRSSLAGLEAKVIRPQDMPQLVASGSFDLAITGRDCLRDHLYRFPPSPVEEVVDLGRGQFDICAVVSCDLQADSVALALEQWRRRGKTVLRVASEFVNIADHYARTRRLGRYRIIPIAGASEGFVPEDADLLIEGTATGRTLVENDLKSIDLLFRSTLCLIAGKGRRPKGRKAEVLRQVISRLKDGARAAA